MAKKLPLRYTCGCHDKTCISKSYTPYPYDIRDSQIYCDSDDNTVLNVMNPFSGQRFKLTGIEESIYSIIMGAQMLPGYQTNNNAIQTVRDGLDWFRENSAEAYMVLLD